VAVLEGVTDFLADRCATRLAKDTNPPTPLPETLCQKCHLGGLATAFGAFERDEQAFHKGFALELRHSR